MRPFIFSKIGTGILAVVVMSASAAAIRAMSIPADSTKLHTIEASDIRAVAAKNGRADGLKRGRSDHRKNLPSSFITSAEYRSGLRGYKPRMGSAEVYKQAYRQAFASGYDAGYNGY